MKNKKKKRKELQNQSHHLSITTFTGGGQDETFTPVQMMLRPLASCLLVHGVNEETVEISPFNRNIQSNSSNIR